MLAATPVILVAIPLYKKVLANEPVPLCAYNAELPYVTTLVLALKMDAALFVFAAFVLLSKNPPTVVVALSNCNLAVASTPAVVPIPRLPAALRALVCKEPAKLVMVLQALPLQVLEYTVSALTQEMQVFF